LWPPSLAAILPDRRVATSKIAPGDFFSEGLPAHIVHFARKPMNLTKPLRALLAGLVLTGSLLCATPTLADQAVNPEVQKADAQREQIAHRERMLLLFPAAALGITIALIFFTRRK
tara:strand:+ start:13183 stop:13530 length:348 start_codon:yes stop_codon:yes gene_type:complete